MSPWYWLVVVGCSSLATCVAAAVAYHLGRLAGWREAAVRLEEMLSRYPRLPPEPLEEVSHSDSDQGRR